ncbi:ALLC-like protein [Mya arenaria]|uniref:Allantoate amidinohydrolase n=1 Tax=Mya arenaria TaxID=6604 RepID=A0ABY7EAC2_MYAAR|nr:ALLC-like protein [Mya arenaria]
MATAVINQFGSTSASEPAFTAYNDLASTKVGGKVLFATDDWFAQAENLLKDWEFIVSLSELKPGFPKSSHNYFHCSGKKKYTHLRLNIYPDGGVARLRVYGQARRDWSKVSERKIVDLLSALNGGLCLQCSRSNGGGGRNLIQAGRGSSVEDGWVVTPLVEVDTNNFKGNFPDVCRVEACFLDNSANDLDTNIPKSKWRTLLPVTKLKAHNQHFFYQDQLEKNTGVVSHVRLTVMPDGGVSRFRIWGTKANRAIAKL